MALLRITKEKGTITVAGVTDWGWQKEKGMLYYRKEGRLHRVKCIDVKEIK